MPRYTPLHRGRVARESRLSAPHLVERALTLDSLEAAVGASLERVQKAGRAIFDVGFDALDAGITARERVVLIASNVDDTIIVVDGKTHTAQTGTNSAEGNRLTHVIIP